MTQKCIESCGQCGSIVGSYATDSLVIVVVAVVTVVIIIIVVSAIVVVSIFLSSSPSLCNYRVLSYHTHTLMSNFSLLKDVQFSFSTTSIEHAT